jgi:RNA recognition motif-containing protein
VPLFEKIGKIYDLRLMMDPTNGRSRGYAFVIYFDKAHAAEAAKQVFLTTSLSISVASNRFVQNSKTQQKQVKIKKISLPLFSISISERSFLALFMEYLDDVFIIGKSKSSSFMQL